MLGIIRKEIKSKVNIVMLLSKSMVASFGIHCVILDTEEVNEKSREEQPKWSRM